MAALETRAAIDAQGDFYLTRLPLSGETADQFAAGIEAAVTGPRRQELVEIRVDSGRGGMGYQFRRDQTAVLAGTEHTRSERVEVIRSAALADTQARAWERRLEKAEAAVRAWTPPPGRGQVQFTVGWALEKAVAAVLAEHDVVGLWEVAWTREETSRSRYLGRGRGGPSRPQTTELTIRYQITEVRRQAAAIPQRWAPMGWGVQVTHVPAERLSLSDSVAVYRGGWSLERDFHLLKDRPLGISPLGVRRDDQVVGLTHLLTLALRVLTLFEVLVRRGQAQGGEKLKGLYTGEASRTTDRPTAVRVLEAIARAELTVSRIESWDDCRWHLTPLPHLLKRVLAYLGLTEAVYTRLVINSS
jgi:transposase